LLRRTGSHSNAEGPVRGAPEGGKVLGGLPRQTPQSVAPEGGNVQPGPREQRAMWHNLLPPFWHIFEACSAPKNGAKQPCSSARLCRAKGCLAPFGGPLHAEAPQNGANLGGRPPKLAPFGGGPVCQLPGPKGQGLPQGGRKTSPPTESRGDWGGPPKFACEHKRSQVRPRGQKPLGGGCWSGPPAGIACGGAGATTPPARVRAF